MMWLRLKDKMCPILKEAAIVFVESYNITLIFILC